MNNLHGWAMRSYLSYGRFTWLKHVDNFDVNSISEMGPMIYILEVDLKHTDELLALHNDYPLARQKLAISYDIL